LFYNRPRALDLCSTGDRQAAGWQAGKRQTGMLASRFIVSRQMDEQER